MSASSSLHCAAQPVALQVERMTRMPAAAPGGPAGPSGPRAPAGPGGPASPFGPGGAWPQPARSASSATAIKIRNMCTLPSPQGPKLKVSMCRSCGRARPSVTVFDHIDAKGTSRQLRTVAIGYGRPAIRMISSASRRARGFDPGQEAMGRASPLSTTGWGVPCNDH